MTSTGQWAFTRKCSDGSFENLKARSFYYLISTGPKDQPGIDGGLLKKRDPRQPMVNTVAVENLDNTIRLVEQNGGKCVLPRMAIPGVGWLAYFKDPEGNMHGVIQPDPAAQ